MAYINKDNLINDINEAWERHYDKCNDKLPNDIYRMFINKINKAPTADVVEVKHGKWLRTDAFPHRVYCSECFKTYVTNENIIDGRNETIGPTYCTEAEYCPHCSTKMDKE